MVRALENVTIYTLFSTEDHSLVNLHEVRELIHIFIENEDKGNT